MGFAETITVPPNGQQTINVSDGETFENTLIDVSARGARVYISARGDGWTIRNIAVRGVQSPGGGDLEAAIRARVPSGGTATIDTVYLGDGTTRGQCSGITVAHDHAGTLTISNVHAAKWARSGIDANKFGWSRNRNWPLRPGWGTVHIKNCYIENCNVGGVLMPSTGSTITDTTIVVDDHAPPRPLPNGSLGRDMNGVWVRADGRSRDTIRRTDILVTDAMSNRSPACVTAGEVKWSVPPYGGKVLIQDCQLQRKWANHRELGNGSVNTRNVGQNPSRTPPSGVPISPGDAAAPDPEPPEEPPDEPPEQPPTEPSGGGGVVLALAVLAFMKNR